MEFRKHDKVALSDGSDSDVFTETETADLQVTRVLVIDENSFQISSLDVTVLEPKK